MDPIRIVAIDIGNSSTDVGLFEDSTLLQHDFLPSASEYSEKIYGIVESLTPNLDHVVIGSVVPALGDLLETLIFERRNIAPLMVDDFKTELLPLLVDRPKSVGVDRIVNCFAVSRLYDLPAIVVSLGTATTFEAISADGEYLGGAIAPGVKISLEALTQRTALLPPVVWDKPKELIAKNTLDHMKSGIYYGSLSMIEGMIRRIKQKLGGKATVIGTGGVSNIFADENIFDIHDTHLNLRGLELVSRSRFGQD